MDNGSGAFMMLDNMTERPLELKEVQDNADRTLRLVHRLHGAESGQG